MCELGFLRKYLVDDAAVGNELTAEVLALVLCQVFYAPAVTSPFPLVGDVKSFRGQANPIGFLCAGHVAFPLSRWSHESHFDGASHVFQQFRILLVQQDALLMLIQFR